MGAGVCFAIATCCMLPALVWHIRKSHREVNALPPDSRGSRFFWNAMLAMDRQAARVFKRMAVRAFLIVAGWLVLIITLLQLSSLFIAE